MNTKNFIIAGIVGGVADFLLGWLFYGIIFFDFFGGDEPELGMIAAGCFSFGFLMSYIYVGLAGISGFAAGMKVGAGLGLLLSLVSNFFMRSMDNPVNWQHFGIDVMIGVIVGALVGGLVATVNRKTTAAN